METKDWIIVGIVVILVITAVVTLAWYLISRNKKEKEKREVEEKEREKAILQDKIDNVRIYFGCELGSTLKSKNYAYNEIVRIVNLLAFETAEICVLQDKINRGLVFGSGDKGCLDTDVQDKKTEWASERKVALKINPKLEDRLPHFSEFEPLKSYNAEHLLKKKAFK